MFVEWLRIPSPDVCFMHTLDESCSKHAIHVLLHLGLARIRAIPALVYASRLRRSDIHQPALPSHSLVLGE